MRLLVCSCAFGSLSDQPDQPDQKGARFSGHLVLWRFLLMLVYLESIYRFCTIVFTDWFLSSPMSVLFYIILFYTVFVLFLRLSRCFL